MSSITVKAKNIFEKNTTHILLVIITITAIAPFFLSLLTSSAHADPPGTPGTVPTAATWIVDGPVTASLYDNNSGNLYLGGLFERVGPSSGYGVPMNTSNAAISTYPFVNGDVDAVVSDGSGGWYIGGIFSYVGGIERDDIAHITSSGTVDPAFNADMRGSGNVSSLLLYNGHLYAGGGFSTVNGNIIRNGAASFDPTTGAVTNWDPDITTASHTPGGVSSLALVGSYIFIGGGFSFVNGGTSQQNLAEFDSVNGNLVNWNPAPDEQVNALASYGSILYVGGHFQRMSSTARASLAAFDLSSGAPATPTTWDPDIADLSFVDTMSLNTNGTVIYTGGMFNGANGNTANGGVVVSRTNLAAFFTSGSGPLTSWNPSVGCLYCIIQSLVYDGTNTSVYTGTGQSGVLTTNPTVVKTDATTGAVDSNWNPDPDSQVEGMAIQGSQIYLGGSFIILGGYHTSGLTAINQTTGIGLNWNPSINFDVLAGGTGVNSIVISNNVLYIAGGFSQVTGQNRAQIAAFTLTGGQPANTVNSFNPGISDCSYYNTPTHCAAGETGVYQIAVSGTTLYAVGGFTSVGYVAPQTYNRYGGAAFNTTNSALLSWDPSGKYTPNGSITNYEPMFGSMYIYGSQIYLGGYFDTLNRSTTPVSIQNLARVDATTGLVDQTWTPSPNSAVETMLSDGTTLYIGGLFTSVFSTNRDYVAAINLAAGTLNTTWNPDITGATGFPGGVYTLAFGNNSGIFVGGSFTTINTGTNPISRDNLTEVDTATGSAFSWYPNMQLRGRTLTVVGYSVYMGGDTTGSGQNLLEGPVGTNGRNEFEQGFFIQYDPGSGNPTPTPSSSPTPTTTTTLTPTTTPTVVTTTTAPTSTPKPILDILTAPGKPITPSPTTNTTPTWTWEASTSSLGYSIVYTFQWCSNNTFTNCSSNTASTTQTTFTHTTPLTLGTWYARVVATDTAGTVSAFSPTGMVVIYALTPTPSGGVTYTPTISTSPTESITNTSTKAPTSTPTLILTPTPIIPIVPSTTSTPPIIPIEIGGIIFIGFTDVGTAYTGITSLGIIVGEILNTILTFLLDIPLQIPRLLNFFLELINVRKKPKPWGVLYDSVTKMPVDPAIITLFQKIDGTFKEVETRTPDFQGRFGFLVDAGTYVIKVTRQNYYFPSKRLAGATIDGDYGNLYFGQELVVENPDLLNVNIPIDSVQYDWNQTQKPVFYKRHRFGLNTLKNVVFGVGIILSALIYIISPTILNLLIFLLYPISFILGRILLTRKKWGIVYDENTHQTLPLVTVKAIKELIGHDVTEGNSLTDHLGRYYMILNEGKHHLEVGKKTDTGEKLLAKTDEINVTKDDTIMNPDIPVNINPNLNT